MEQGLDITLADGQELSGVLHRPAEPAAAAVLICHGMLSHKDSPKHRAVAEGLCRRGIAALRFDFLGRGQSPGDLLRLSFSGQVDQARAALEVLGRATGAERIGLVGSSMGGAVAVLLAGAGDLQPAGLVTLAAVARTDLLAERVAGPRGLAVWRRKGFLRLEGEPVGWSLVEDGRRVDVVAAAGRVACPWLILHGQDDAVVPPTDARLLEQAAGRRAVLEIVPGADHAFTDPGRQAVVVERAVEFLAGALAGGSGR